MKQYHTEIVINASIDKIWEVLTDFSAYPSWNPLVGWLKGDFCTDGEIQMFIIPLNRSFNATLQRVQQPQELTWIGIKGASWFLSGEHYYRLEAINLTSVRLFHGEYFRGLGSWFIGQSMLDSMETAFRQHNVLLKERIEHE